jgi:hypothetical protein
MVDVATVAGMSSKNFLAHLARLMAAAVQPVTAVGTPKPLSWTGNSGETWGVRDVA